MKRILIIFILQLTTSAVGFADHNTHLYEQANELYEKGQYSQAIEKYEEILSIGFESWEVYFNLGNAYFKNAQLGKSILNYERTIILAPKNEDVQFNLALANLSVVDQINVPEPLFLFKIFSDFKKYFSINALSFIVILCYLSLIAFIILWIFLRKRNLQKTATLFIVLMTILLIIFGSTLFLRVKDKNSLKFGILLAPKVDVVGSPEENGTEIFSLHEGVKMQITKEIDDWFQIRLADGKIGWVKQNALEKIQW